MLYLTAFTGAMQKNYVMPVSAYHITDITKYPLSKNRFVIPELPPRCVDYNKQSQFITGIHKCRVLWIMGITDDTQTGIT